MLPRGHKETRELGRAVSGQKSGLEQGQACPAGRMAPTGLGG